MINLGFAGNHFNVSGIVWVIIAGIIVIFFEIVAFIAVMALFDLAVNMIKVTNNTADTVKALQNYCQFTGGQSQNASSDPNTAQNNFNNYSGE